MKIDTEQRDDHQVKLTVEVEAEILDGAKRRAARQIAKRVKIPGFRPGKAPYNVVQKQVGDAAILEDALDMVLDDIYPQVIEDAKIQPYGPGSLEKVASMEQPIFEINVPLAPEVTLGKYREIRIPFKLEKINENDVDAALKNLQDQQAVIEPTDHPAQEGDQVNIRIRAERKTASDEGGEKTLIEPRSFPVVIEAEDTDSDDEWPFPGFSRELLGLSAGDEKQVEYTFPKDSNYEELRGVPALFHVTVEDLKARVLPELNDEFAQSVGDFSGIEELRSKVQESLEKNSLEKQNAEYESQIIDKILEDAEIKYPPQMVEHEIDHIIADINRRLASQGLDMETYLKSREMEVEGLREEAKPTAEERLRRSLVLMEVSETEEISVDSEEVDEIAAQQALEISQYLPPDQANQVLTGEGLQNLKNRIETEELTKRTLMRLREISKGELPAQESQTKGAAGKKGKPAVSKTKSEEKPKTKSKAKSKTKKKAKPKAKPKS